MLPLKLLMPIFLTGAGGILVATQMNKKANVGVVVNNSNCKHIGWYYNVEGEQVTNCWAINPNQAGGAK